MVKEGVRVQVVGRDSLLGSKINKNGSPHKVFRRATRVQVSENILNQLVFFRIIQTLPEPIPRDLTMYWHFFFRVPSYLSQDIFIAKFSR
jgi:hypothetical protein